MFYERYLALCADKNIKPSTAATQAGFNRGTVSVWKKKFEKGQDVSPDQDVIDKICTFFGCTEQWLRGMSTETKKAPAHQGERKISDDDMKAAFYGGYSDALSQDEIDELWEDAKEYARFKASQRINKKF